jgi:type IV secretory pathway TrbD component
MAHHGNTPAAWTGVLIILVGFVVAGIGLIIDNWVVFWIGVVLWPIALVVGSVMARLGMGSDPVHSSDHR